MTFVEKDFAKPTRHNPYLHKILIEELSDLPKGEVLDIPSGPGYLLRDLKELGFGGVAAEIDDNLHCLREIDYRKVDMIGRFPFSDTSFDYVLSVEGIEHIENHFAFLREVQRILKTGGKLLLTTPNVQSLESRFGYFFSGFHKLASKPIPLDSENIYFEHINPISFPQLYFICESFGLNVEKLTTHRFQKGSTFWYYLLFPFIYFSIYSACFIREKNSARRAANKKLFRFLKSRANLCGTHTIIVATKVR